MIFLKYRHTFAYGRGEWEYQFLSNSNDLVIEEEILEDYIWEFKNEYNWSDKYRGIEYELVKYPPKKWVKEKLKQFKNMNFIKRLIFLFKGNNIEE